MLQKIDRVKMHSYPGMVAVVGTYGNENPNFMAAGWHSFLSINPPMYGVAIGRERFTYKCLQQKKEFTVNFLPESLAEFIQLSGSVSGEDVNKIEIANLQSKDAETVDAPYLENAYIVYECSINNMVSTGDHEWVIGDIETCRVDEGLFQEDGLPNFEKLNIPLYLGRSTYVTLDAQAKQKQYKKPYEDDSEKS
ncbi:flavin reductase family protein [Pontibacillus sp. HMF3514]|uniref:flavin reductase family protein n=1 Tax=Pontibacillus sp. HMF3514 TaxID=2692425 RepID=UPI00132030B4|nr:flavin reductase family protein [Pontibacillus sp. HMF3514]QHE53011.1 flavin oxidoreductase [Pontibacillus sp. HMF3514]